jgi:hypothetical protein
LNPQTLKPTEVLRAQ